MRLLSVGSGIVDLSFTSARHRIASHRSREAKRRQIEDRIIRNIAKSLRYEPILHIGYRYAVAAGDAGAGVSIFSLDHPSPAPRPRNISLGKIRRGRLRFLHRIPIHTG